MIKFTCIKNFLFATLLFCSANLFATTLLVEDFDYTIGANITAHGWTNYNYNGNAISVVDGLSFPGYAGSGIGGAASGLANVTRSFSAQTSGTIYVAFILQTPSSTLNTTSFFCLGEIIPEFTTTTLTGVANLMYMDGTGSAIGLNYVSNSITPNVPVLIVLKHDFSSHTSSLFILNSYSATEPSPTQTLSESPTKIESVCFRNPAVGAPTIDGIRVATTWAEACAASEDGGGDDGGDDGGNEDDNNDEPLLIENFDYPTGAKITDNNWIQYNGGTTSITVTDGLSFSGYAGSNIGGAVEIGGEWVARTFPAQTTGNVYVAFLLKTSSSTTAAPFLSLSENPANLITTIAKLGASSADGTKIGFNFASNSITPNVSTLVVLKYDFSNQTSSLFILDSYSATEPATANQTITESSPSIGSVCFRNEGITGVIIDGIRVATTWEVAVAPPAPSTPFIIGTTEKKLKSDYENGNYNDIIIMSDDNATGQLDLQGGTLSVNGAIKLQKTVTAGRWYSIGFPFAVGTVNSLEEEFVNNNWNPLLPYRQDDPYSTDNYGDYWLKEYAYYAANSPFSYTTESFAAGKGYIFKCADYLNATDIHFISNSNTLNAGSLDDVTTEYQLLANPGFTDLELTQGDDNKYYYKYDPTDNKFERPENVLTIAPFESVIAISTDNPGNLKSSLAIDIATGILPPRPAENDPVVATHYFTVQGTTIIRPVEAGIYIVRNQCQSGKESVTKVFINKKK
jgi:hypothetical protein